MKHFFCPIKVQKMSKILFSLNLNLILPNLFQVVIFSWATAYKSKEPLDIKDWKLQLLEDLDPIVRHCNIFACFPIFYFLLQRKGF